MLHTTKRRAGNLNSTTQYTIVFSIYLYIIPTFVQLPNFYLIPLTDSWVMQQLATTARYAFGNIDFRYALLSAIGTRNLYADLALQKGSRIHISVEYRAK